MADHYCAIEDVNALVPNAPFDNSSRPTQIQVEAFIEQIGQRIDATISGVGYAVPVVTGTKALGLLREVCAWGALGMAQMVRSTAVKVAVDDRGQPVDNIWTMQFKAWLKALVSPQDPFELPDAARTNEALVKQPQNVLRSFVQGDEGTFANDPVVTRYQVL